MTIQAIVMPRAVEDLLLEEPAGDGEQQPGERVGEGDHRPPPDRVEEAAEQERPEEIAGREGQHDTSRHCPPAMP